MADALQVPPVAHEIYLASDSTCGLYKKKSGGKTRWAWDKMYMHHAYPQRCTGGVMPGCLLQDITRDLQHRDDFAVHETDCTIVVCMLNSKRKTMLHPTENIDLVPNLLALCHELLRHRRPAAIIGGDATQWVSHLHGTTW